MRGMKYFHGKIDFNALSLDDLQKASRALNMLSELAQQSLIEFSIGLASPRGDKPVAEQPVAPQEKMVLDHLAGKGWLRADELQGVLTMRPSSLTAALTRLVQKSLVTRKKVTAPAASQHRTCYAYHAMEFEKAVVLPERIELSTSPIPRERSTN